MSVREQPAPAWSGRDDPEDGAGAIRLHHLAGAEGARAVIGFACDAGVARNKGRPGAAEGPTALRSALANMAAPAGPQPFADLGDVVVEGDALEAGQDRLAERIGAALGGHERVVVLGGGHETALASWRGLRAARPDARIGIINLDAHLDLRTVGAAGGSSGTPFAQIRALDPERFDYLCLGAAEEANTTALFERAQAWGVGVITDHQLIAEPSCADAAIADLIARNDCVYLTLDIDLLPHFQAPGVSAPAARGVPLSTVEHLVQTVLDTAARLHRPVPVADIVELCPPRDRDGVTARTAALLARRLLTG